MLGTQLLDVAKLQRALRASRNTGLLLSRSLEIDASVAHLHDAQLFVELRRVIGTTLTKLASDTDVGVDQNPPVIGILRDRRHRTGLLANGSLAVVAGNRSEEHTSELQSLMRISYAVFCLKKKKT